MNQFVGKDSDFKDLASFNITRLFLGNEDGKEGI
jgi:hypothetical protein